jgi:hypothetical protein
VIALLQQSENELPHHHLRMQEENDNDLLMANGEISLPKHQDEENEADHPSFAYQKNEDLETKKKTRQESWYCYRNWGSNEKRTGYPTMTPRVKNGPEGRWGDQ